MQDKVEFAERKENILGTQSIGRLLVKFSLPGIISMVINSLYNIVDQIFIGQEVGFLGNGATNVIFPIVTLVLALSLLIGDGAANYMSLMLGKKREEDAARGVAFTVVACLIGGVFLSVLVLSLLEPLCWLFGATDLTLPYALEYGRIIAFGIPLSTVAVGFAGVIRADGSPAYNMTGLVVGCVTNIILDPIFISVFQMGVKGAAIATVIGQAANAVIYVIYFFRFKTIKLKRSTFKGCFKALPKVLKLGASSFINQAVIVVIVAVQNNMLTKYGAMSEYGAEIPMTALGVTMKVFNIIIAIVIGLCSGSQPIWGYNYGSGRRDRVKKTFIYSTVVATAVMTLALIIFQSFPEQVVSIFGNEDSLYTDFSVKCLRIYLLLLPINAIRMTGGSLFQAVGQPIKASIISLSKQILLQLPLLVLMPMFMGIDGILWAGPVSDVLSTALALVLLAKSSRSIFSPVQREAEKNEGEGAPASPLSGSRYVVTIGRSYGAGGRSVGKAVAEKLGIAYYDKSILAAAAEQSGIDRDFIEYLDEKDSGSMAVTAVAKDAELAKIKVIEEAAQKGPCVIVGRRADKILKDRCRVISVFIGAAVEKRINRVMERDMLSEEEARRKILKVDKERARYYGDNEEEWGSACNYDICLDCGTLDFDEAADIICSLVKNETEVKEA